MKLLGVSLLVVAGVATSACGPTDPETMYTDLGCPRCHGFHLEGNRYGPSLEKLSQNWDSAAQLGAYLRDPAATIESIPRLKAQDANFELKMQPVTNVSDDDLARLSAWLLTAE